jgi:hypothetical protein
MHEHTRHYHLGCGERLQTDFSDRESLRNDHRNIINRFVVKPTDKQRKAERSK